MRRDWRAASSILTLVLGLFFLRESLVLNWEDVGSGGPAPKHRFYGWISSESCWNGWKTEGQILRWRETCHSHPDVIEYLAVGLLILTIALLIWIWWKPLRK